MLFRSDLEAYASRWRGFGWHAVVVDGHDLAAITAAFDEARRTKGQPTMILARTLKGKGIALAEGKAGWHGKAFKKGAELDGVIAALEAQLIPDAGLPPAPPAPTRVNRPAPVAASVGTPGYALGDSVATREAYGAALGKLGADQRVVALDADVKNSTFSEKFEERFRDRFHEN